MNSNNNRMTLTLESEDSLRSRSSSPQSIVSNSSSLAQINDNKRKEIKIKKLIRKEKKPIQRKHFDYEGATIHQVIQDYKNLKDLSDPQILYEFIFRVTDMFLRKTRATPLISQADILKVMQTFGHSGQATVSAKTIEGMVRNEVKKMVNTIVEFKDTISDSVADAIKRGVKQEMGEGGAGVIKRLLDKYNDTLATSMKEKSELEQLRQQNALLSQKNSSLMAQKQSLEVQLLSQTQLNESIVNENCSLCLYPMYIPDSKGQRQVLKITNCHHIFHSVCLQQARQAKNVCPMCRVVLFDAREFDIFTK